MEIKELQEELKKAKEQISSLMAEKKAFIRIVSHDLRSPISRIIGFADLLEKDLEENADLKFFATNIVGAGWQLSNMITRIVEIEDFESDDREITPTAVEIAQSTRALIEEHQAAFEKKNIDLVVGLQECKATGVCDKMDFDLIVNNLLTNAVKFTPEGGKVVVEVEDESDATRLVLTDDGPGFKEEEKHLIFNKFTKLSAKPTGGETATGLGLYVVKRCADRNKIQLEVINPGDQGTTIIATFPKSVLP